MQHQAGDIVVYSAWQAVWYCLMHGQWPGWHQLAAALITCLYWPFTASSYSHALVYVGHDMYVHTKLGKVRCEHARLFPPGYLAACAWVRPPFQLVSPVIYTGLSVGLPWGLLLAPLIRRRWISDVWHNRPVRHCSQLVATCIVNSPEAAPDHKAPFVLTTGVYPSDFLQPRPGWKIVYSTHHQE